jgi:hypothetical protein
MKKFPTEAVPTGSPEPAPVRGKGTTQKVLLLATFVAVVAGIAFAAQFVPSWNRGGKDPIDAGPVVPLVFHSQFPHWDPMRQDYGAEFENGTRGHHHCYLFDNRNDSPVEVGLLEKTCACSRIDLCLLSAGQAAAVRASLRTRDQLQAAAAFPGSAGQSGLYHLFNLAAGGNDGCGDLESQGLSWQRMIEDSKHRQQRVVVPARSAGLVRLRWDGDRRRDERLLLQAHLWTQIQGRPRSVKVVTLGALVAYVPPVRTYPAALTIDEWDSAGVGRAEFRCWSSTRLAFSLLAREGDGDACVETKLTPLTGSECRQLERVVPKDKPTQVLSGYRVQVTVYQAKGSSQLERGHFERWIHLASAGVPDISPVRLRGVIRDSDVEVGAAADLGMINLGNFRAAVGKRGMIFLRTGAGVKLSPHFAKKPDFLEVVLKEVESGGANGPTEWQLRVEVPPNPPRTWPSDSAIILETKQEDGKTRRIRIPVQANPYQ